MTGTSPPGTNGAKCRANRSVSIVADVMTTLEVAAAGEQLREVAEDQVDVEAALVRLVDDQRVVPAQQPVVRDLRQQDAVGHDLDERVVAGVCR